MEMSFLLRFREKVEVAPSESAFTATQTQTYVRTEQADSDRRHNDFHLLPSHNGTTIANQDRVDFQTASVCGTQTFTEQKTESSDSDPATHDFQTIPKELC